MITYVRLYQAATRGCMKLTVFWFFNRFLILPLATVLLLCCGSPQHVPDKRVKTPPALAPTSQEPAPHKYSAEVYDNLPPKTFGSQVFRTYGTLSIDGEGVHSISDHAPLSDRKGHYTWNVMRQDKMHPQGYNFHKFSDKMDDEGKPIPALCDESDHAYLLRAEAAALYIRDMIAADQEFKCFHLQEADSRMVGILEAVLGSSYEVRGAPPEKTMPSLRLQILPRSNHPRKFAAELFPKKNKKFLRTFITETDEAIYVDIHMVYSKAAAQIIAEYVQQLQLALAAKSIQKPIIIAGDFNASLKNMESYLLEQAIVGVQFHYGAPAANNQCGCTHSDAIDGVIIVSRQ
jgi:hypothetical protein